MAGCAGVGAAPGGPAAAGHARRAAGPTVALAAGGRTVLEPVWAPYQLPSPVTGVTAAPHGATILLTGGAAGPAGRPASALLLNPVTGRTRPAPSGERAGPTPAGLTASRAVAVAAGSTTYLVGGTGQAGTVRAVTAAGSTRVVGRLPVSVSYPAATIAGGQIWVFGGETARGPVNVIQRVSLAGRGASIAGTLPAPSAGASAFALQGSIFVAGGYLPSPGRLSALYPSLLAGGRADAPGVLAAAPRSTSGQVLRFDPASGTVSVAADLPMPVARAGVAVLGSTAYLVGGSDGSVPMPSVVTLRMVPAAQALPGSLANRGPLAAPWLAPAHGPGHLAPGSNPAALPADVLVADHLNSRLIIIDPHGRVRWTFPQPGDLAPGQTFKVPDDAFFSPDGRYIVATQEDNQVISVISIAEHRIVYRYGRPGTPGTGPNRLDNPDDAMLLPGGDILAADIKNCRILLLAPPAHRPARVIGQTTHACLHAPPQRFGSPNGAFPLTDGRYLVTEINGDWASSMGLNGHVQWSTHPPGVAYPSDTNEVYPGRYLTADYSPAGQVVEFSRAGRLLWRFGGLNQPSLAEPLPNGDVLVNDDFNDRIIVIDPATNKIVWQYGHTGVAGRAPGYLNDPDGLDLVPPYSMLIRHAATAGRP
ncbi:MAG: hypothetical protein M0030_08605 [Actinomycetota bacterium]|nr:hypothetical protein [Actinomycetota bacterium]